MTTEQGNSLFEQYPELAAEWDYEKNTRDPSTLTPGSGVKVSWKCRKKQHSWDAPIFNRTSGHGCPYCAGNLPIPGETDLQTLCPDLAAEWDYTMNQKHPSDYTAHSNVKVSWRCERGHTWVASINSRARGRGCPYCSGRFPIPGETDLQTLRPDLAAEWDYTVNEKRPSDYTASSGMKVSWRCEMGHTWTAGINSRARGRGCPFCAGVIPIPGETDLQTLRPDIAAEWDYEKNLKSPAEYTVGSSEKVSWRCEKGHSWNAVIQNRTKENGTGCPYCSGNLPIPGETDLMTLRPDIAAEWDHEKNTTSPRDHTVCSSAIAAWRCQNKHSWNARIYSRTNGRGCPYCTGKLPVPGETDLLTLRPDLVKEWDYERNKKLPSDYSAHSNAKVSWRCEHGHMWEAVINNRAKGHGCPYCAGSLPISGETDLLTVCPDIVAEWDHNKNKKLPSDYAVKSDARVSWRCKQGHTWESSIKNRTSGNGCPYCNKRKKWNPNISGDRLC